GGEDGIHEADLGGRPGDHRVVVGSAAHGHISAPVGLSADDGDLRHRGQAGRVHEVHDMTGRSAALRVSADHEAGRVHEADKRYVEAVAHHGEIDDLATRLG